MPSRFDYLVRKLDELDDAIRRERREYDKARDRYEKMRTRDILEDLIEQRVLPLLLAGYRTEHDQIQSAHSARVPPRSKEPAQQQQHRPPPRQGAAPSHAQRDQQHGPPPPQYRPTYPDRPSPNQRHAFTAGNNHAPNGNTAGPARGQPSRGSQRPRPPRPRQKTQVLDIEIEEPDGKSYTVKGGGVVRDFDPARDTVRRTE